MTIYITWDSKAEPFEKIKMGTQKIELRLLMRKEDQSILEL